MRHAMKYLAVIAIAPIGLCALPTAASAANAATPKATVAPDPGYVLNENLPPAATPSELEERELSRQQGASPAQVRSELDAQQSFLTDADLAEEQYPEYFAEASWDAQAETGEISFTKQAPGAVRDRINAGLGRGPSKVSFQRSKSARSMLKAHDKLVKNLLRTNPKGEWSVRTDGAHDALTVTTTEDVNAAMTSALADADLSGVTVKHISQKTNFTPTAEVVGGADLNVNNSQMCTAAFVTVNAKGQRGLSSAAHCPDYMNYGNYAWLNSATPAPNGADVQNHLTSRVTSAQFVFQRGTLTTAKSVPTLRNGMTVNRYGRNTSKIGAVINTTDVTNNFPNAGTYYHLAETYDECSSIGGDSGGPYWTGVSGGATAIGVHTGNGSDVWGNHWCYLSSAARFPEFFGTAGVRVVTG